jgi:antirestriction protein ArdC
MEGAVERARMKSVRADVYQRVTDYILKEIRRGPGTWVSGWGAFNVKSGRPYRGINALLLSRRAAERGYSDPRWLTFLQAREAGGSVRKGEKGTPIVFYKKMVELDSEGMEKRRSLLRFSTVFNVEQCEGIEPRPVEPQNLEASQQQIDEICRRHGVVLKTGGLRAFYRSSDDSITVPDRGQFHSACRFQSTLLHELVHWTGHPSRLNRKMGGIKKTPGGEFVTDEYAFEELVAEIGSAFLCAHFNITGEMQHAAYLAHYIEMLEEDSTAIFKAASAAQKAADYLLDDDADANLCEDGG